MFTLYTVLLTLHILLVILWLGAGITVLVISHQARENPDWAPIASGFAQRWFPPISGLTGVVGILLWIDGPWDAGEIWIGIAVVGWLISSAVGATQLAPAVEKWAQGDLAARDRFLQIAPFDTLLLVLIVCDMVLKPGL